MKLKQSIQSNSVKIIELYNKIEGGQLETGPDFQRKLVWKKQHKYAFIQTILWNYPFPEIYIASADLDVENLKAVEIVVDGQQRLTTIVDYIKGRRDFASQNKVIGFDKLSIDEKKDFLNYSVTVKDLKSIEMDKIKEIFKRINSTDYALNANEIINAQFGDGEFSLFCKQLADKTYPITDDDTDVIVDAKRRGLVNSFFEENKIFSENDIKRMFDSQYLMLICSTLLEGNYFSRSTKINYYLEKYNAEFAVYQTILDQIVNSLKIIQRLKFSFGSYWFNKPNLFNLIIEFSKIKPENLNFEVLEKELLDLEEKVDIYFDGTEEQIKLLSTDENKFFEVSRQGSNELAAREHRAKVVREIIKKAITVQDVEKETGKNSEEGRYATIIPTATGLSKSIMDATSTVREFLKVNNIHDYDTQLFGPQNKKKIQGYFISKDGGEQATEISLYRSNGRGDYRIWFSGLTDFAKPENILRITYNEGKLYIYNSSEH